MKVKCLLCEKDLQLSESGLIDDAGFIYVEFHYGSKHDQCKGFGHYGFDETLQDRLLGSDEIEAYICDDCFDKKHHLMRGFNKIVERTRKETTNGKEE
jgi:uncharacterized protein YlaI